MAKLVKLQLPALPVWLRRPLLQRPAALLDVWGRAISEIVSQIVSISADQIRMLLQQQHLAAVFSAHGHSSPDQKRMNLSPVPATNILFLTNKSQK
jgi:hypothetical protein